MTYRQISLHAFCQYVLGCIDKTGANGCWMWRGPRGPMSQNTGYGYSAYASPSGTHAAHRVVWEVLVGPIEPGLVIDHLCCNKLCVNPAHLEPVTQSENSSRGDRGRSRKARSERLDAARQRDAEERQRKAEERADSKISPATRRWLDEVAFHQLVHRLGPTSCGPAFYRLCQLD